MFNWLHNYSPQPVLIDWGIIRVYWYGLLISLAAALCLAILFKLNKSSTFQQGLSAHQFLVRDGKVLDKQKKEMQSHLGNLFFYLIIFGLIGGRLWHVVFYNFSYFLENPLAVFKIWQGGLAISGAIIAGIITVYAYCRKHCLPFWHYADLLALVLPLGQAIGRLGNYFNQELFGAPCNFSWCIPIEAANRLPEYLQDQYFHPVFLYEALLNLLLFAILWLIFKRGRLLKAQGQEGILTFVYLLGYSLIRFFMEFLRLDVANTWLLGLKWTQWLVLGVMIIALLGIFKMKHRQGS